jgi:hypothetical protein
MQLMRELGDAWGALIAAFAGGLTWALSGDVATGVGVGAAVYGVKVATGLLTHREQRRDERGRLLPVADHSAEAQWLRRARAAESAFGDVAASVRGGPTSDL